MPKIGKTTFNKTTNTDKRPWTSERMTKKFNLIVDARKAKTLEELRQVVIDLIKAVV